MTDESRPDEGRTGEFGLQPARVRYELEVRPNIDDFEEPADDDASQENA